MLVCWWLLISGIISLFLFGMLDSLLLLLNYGMRFLLSPYDDKKGDIWMLCVRGSYSEFISLDALCEGELMLICSIFFFLPSIVLSSSKRGRMLTLVPNFWWLQNKWMLLTSPQRLFQKWNKSGSKIKHIWKRQSMLNLSDAQEDSTGRPIIIAQLRTHASEVR